MKGPGDGPDILHQSFGSFLEVKKRSDELRARLDALKSQRTVSLLAHEMLDGKIDFR